MSSNNTNNYFEELITEYLKRDLILFPCKKNTKISSISKWNQLTVSHLKTKKNENNNDELDTDYNFALLCGRTSNLTVVDIDKKNRGVDCFNNFLNDNNLSYNDFCYQKTPNDGYHIFFKYTDKLKTTTNLNNISIDIRNDNGYVLVEPSIIENKRYKIYNLDKIKNIPDIVFKFITNGDFRKNSTINSIMDEITESSDNSSIEDSGIENKKSKLKNKSKSKINSSTSTIIKKNYTNTNIFLFNRLLEIIPEEKIDDYTVWIEILCIIKNIYPDSEALNMFHIISKKSKKYNHEEVEKKFNEQFNNEEGYGYSKLVSICQEINKDLTNEIITFYTAENYKKCYAVKFEKFYSFDFKNNKNDVCKIIENIKNEKLFVKSYNDLVNKIQNEIKPYIIQLVNKEYIYKLENSIVIYNADYFTPAIKFYTFDPKCGVVEHTVNFKEILKDCVLHGPFKEVVVLNKPLEWLVRNDAFLCQAPFYIDTLIWENKHLENKFDIDYLQDFINFLFEIICDSNQNTFDYLINYKRNILSHNRNLTALLLYSHEQGTGKNYYTNFIQLLLGDKAYINGTLTNILNPQTNLSQKSLINIDELACASTEKNKNMEQLKNLITGTKWFISEKFIQSKNIDLNTSLICTTNNYSSLKISKVDRRWSILKVNNKRVQDIEYFDILDKYKTDYGLINIYNYIMNYQVKVNTSKALITDIKEEMVNSQDTIQNYITDIKTNAWICCKSLQDRKRLKGVEIYTDYKLYCESNSFFFKESRDLFLKEISTQNEVFIKKVIHGRHLYEFVLVNSNRDDIPAELIFE